MDEARQALTGSVTAISAEEGERTVRSPRGSFFHLVYDLPPPNPGTPGRPPPRPRRAPGVPPPNRGPAVSLRRSPGLPGEDESAPTRVEVTMIGALITAEATPTPAPAVGYPRGVNLADVGAPPSRSWKGLWIETLVGAGVIAALIGSILTMIGR